MAVNPKKKVVKKKPVGEKSVKKKTVTKKVKKKTPSPKTQAKKENQTLLPLHEHPPKSQHVKILQQVHHVYVKIVFEYIYPAGVTLSLEMQGQHDAEKLLERLKTKGIQFELLT